MTEFSHLKLEAVHLKVLSDACCEDEIKVFSLPGNNLAVPSLFAATHENPLRYIHIRNHRCPLQVCRDVDQQDVDETNARARLKFIMMRGYIYSGVAA